MRFIAPLALALATSLFACSTADPTRKSPSEPDAVPPTNAPIDPPAGSTVSSVSLSRSTLVFDALDRSESLVAEARNAAGAVMSAAIVWTCSDTAIASISTDGMVTAKANGVATVSAAAGSVQATALVTIDQVARTITVAPASLSFDQLKAKQGVSADVRDANGRGMPDARVEWSTSNPAIVTVSATGTVTAISVGMAKVYGRAGTVSAAVSVVVNAATAPPSDR